MPVIGADELRHKTAGLFCSLGVPPEDAAHVAELLVEANLCGHDSHGVIRIPQYARFIRQGQIQPGSTLEVTVDCPAVAVVDGRMNLGAVTMLRVLDMARHRADRAGAYTIFVRNCHHVGRLGAYTSRAARAGYASMMAVNSPGSRCVAPWGGIDRRLGTNPLSLAVPAPEFPLVLDMTTSVVAEGKIRVHYHEGRPLPEGWIIDAEGNPTTDARAFYAQPPGALLPLGGHVGYKGFGLALLLDIFCGVLSGMGCLRPDLTAGQNGVWLTLFRLGAWVSRPFFLEEVQKLCDWIRSSRRQGGVAEILLPGEWEARTMRERLRHGIYIPEETWRQILAVASEVGYSW